MKFEQPIDEGYSVKWTKDNEYFNAYTQEDIAQLKERIASGGVDPTSEFPWLSNGSILSIAATVATGSPLLIADNYRNLLIIQNNSLATSPDVAPNLFVSISGPVQLVAFQNPVSHAISSFAFNAITLQPQEGLLLDTRVLTNAIYVTWGASTNTNGTVYTNGVLMYGRTPNSPPAAPARAMVSQPRVGNAAVNATDKFGRFIR